jgi:hypothetical protein
MGDALLKVKLPEAEAVKGAVLVPPKFPKTKPPVGTVRIPGKVTPRELFNCKLFGPLALGNSTAEDVCAEDPE